MPSQVCSVLWAFCHQLLYVQLEMFPSQSTYIVEYPLQRLWRELEAVLQWLYKVLWCYLNIIWVSAKGLWSVQLYDTVELSSNKNPRNKAGHKFADDGARVPDHRLLKERQQAQRSWITWEYTQIMAVPTSTPV